MNNRMSQMFCVAAIVVTYNRKDLLIECIKSLLEQTYELNKVIIVNNNSTDGTKEFLSTVVDERISVINLDENIGGAGGFCKGMKLASESSCDFLLIMDDDCILEKKYVEKLFDAYVFLNNTKLKTTTISALCGTVYTNDKIALEHRGHFSNNFINKLLRRWSIFTEKEYEQKYLLCDIVSFCGLLIPKSTVLNIGFPIGDYFIRCDDTEYSFRMRKNGIILNVNNAFMNHKVRAKKKHKGLDWKDYYDIRNGIDLSKRHDLLFRKIGIYVRYLLRALNDIYSLELYINAIKDAQEGRLGKNEKYGNH